MKVKVRKCKKGSIKRIREETTFFGSPGGDFSDIPKVTLNEIDSKKLVNRIKEIFSDYTYKKDSCENTSLEKPEPLLNFLSNEIKEAEQAKTLNISINLKRIIRNAESCKKGKE